MYIHVDIRRLLSDVRLLAVKVCVGQVKHEVDCVQSEAAKAAGGREYNGHQFVLVSFSNSAVCDVCSKPLLNKSALQCESTSCFFMSPIRRHIRLLHSKIGFFLGGGRFRP